MFKRKCVNVLYYKGVLSSYLKMSLDFQNITWFLGALTLPQMVSSGIPHSAEYLAYPLNKYQQIFIECKKHLFNHTNITFLLAFLCLKSSVKDVKDLKDRVWAGGRDEVWQSVLELGFLWFSWWGIWSDSDHYCKVFISPSVTFY